MAKHLKVARLPFLTVVLAVFHAARDPGELKLRGLRCCAICLASNNREGREGARKSGVGKRFDAKLG